MRLLRAVRDAGVVALRQRADNLLKLGNPQKAAQVHAQADALATGFLGRFVEANPAAGQPPLPDNELSEEFVQRCLKGVAVASIPHDTILEELAEMAKKGPLLQLARAYKLQQMSEDNKTPRAQSHLKRLECNWVG